MKLTKNMMVQLIEEIVKEKIEELNKIDLEKGNVNEYGRVTAECRVNNGHKVWAELSDNYNRNTTLNERFGYVLKSWKKEKLEELLVAAEEL